MSVELQELLNFHRTGKNRSLKEKKGQALDYRPALFADYGQLTSLRYDYPLVLLEQPCNGEFSISLTDLINGILREIAPEGSKGTRLRQQVLTLELKIRDLMKTTAATSLSDLWRKAEQALLKGKGEEDRKLLEEAWALARGSLKVDGLVIDCDREVPERFLRHYWRSAEAKRTKAGMEKISRLILKLGDILTVDELKSDSSRTPVKLRNSLGSRYQDAFDFEIMAELLNNAPPQARLPEQRKKRIRAALNTLTKQKFFIDSEADASDNQYRFQYQTVSAAMQAWYERLPELVALNNAIAVATLETENRYCEERHDSYLGRLGVHALSPADLAFFPSYFVSLSEKNLDSSEQAIFMDALSSDLPIKVLLQVSDILGSPSPVDLQLHNGVRGQQFASMTVGVNDAFVLQASGSSLYRERNVVERGIQYGGPSLYSVFVGSCTMPADLPPYLSAAAATESRAFPTYSYDPSAGAGMATRYDIHSNPQAESAWSVHELCYQDNELQRVKEDLSFSVLDFATLDSRYADYFEDVPQDSWHESMRPATDYLELADIERQDLVPYVTMIDAENCLHRLVVDDMLIRVAKRCAERWQSLQELGGINNSYIAVTTQRVTEALLIEKEEALQALRDELGNGVATAAPAPIQMADDSAAEVAIEAEAEEPEAAEVNSDEAYIETPRCTTCDECTDRNDRMFAYDENKQAYIADLSAGPYKDLVEAAENCQVAIIHPGKPLNPNEDGLDELLARAAEFN